MKLRKSNGCVRLQTSKNVEECSEILLKCLKRYDEAEEFYGYIQDNGEFWIKRRNLLGYICNNQIFYGKLYSDEHGTVIDGHFDSKIFCRTLEILVALIFQCFSGYLLFSMFSNFFFNSHLYGIGNILFKVMIVAIFATFPITWLKGFSRIRKNNKKIFTQFIMEKLDVQLEKVVES